MLFSGAPSTAPTHSPTVYPSSDPTAYPSDETKDLTSTPTQEPTPTPDEMIIGNSTMSWYEATAYCLRQGLYLASIHSEEDQSNAYEVCNTKVHDDSTGSMGCWIGLRLSSDTGYFEWSDGSDIDFGFSNGDPTTAVYPWSGVCFSPRVSLFGSL